MTTSEARLDAEPYATPNALSPASVDDRSRLSTQTLLVISMYALIAGAGAFGVFYYENLAAYYFCSIAFAVLATSWAINDSRLRGGAFHPVLRMLYLLSCPISPAIYLICTRGPRGIGWAAFHGVAMIVVANVAFYGMFYAVYFTGYWELYDPVYFDP